MTQQATTKRQRNEAETETPASALTDAPSVTTIEVSPEDTTADSNVKARPAETKALRDLKNIEHLELKEYLQNTLQGATQFVIGVTRVKPETARHPRTGVPIKTAGHLRNYGEFIDESTIRENHGGGTYVLRIRAPNAMGKFVFLTSRTIEVAGEPLLDELLARDVTPLPPTSEGRETEHPSLVKEALNMAKEQAELARADRDAAIERATRGGGRNEGISMHEISGAIDRAIAPFKHQIDMLMAQLASKDAVIADLQKREPPRDEFKDTMLKRLVEDDSARLQTVRAQYESEIRILKEGEQSRIDRAIERAERDRAADRQSHERELANMRAMNETAQASAKSSHEMTVTLLREELRRNERHIDRIEKELADLKAKKDKTLLEQVKDIKALKEGLADDDDEGGEKSLIDRAADILSPDGMQAVGAVVAAVRGQTAQQQQPQQPQVPRVVQGPNGEKFVVRGNQLIPAKRREQAAPQQAQPAAPAPEVPGANIPDAQITDTVHKLELAYHNELEPEAVADMARDQIPPDVLDAIRQHGLDVILHKRAKLSSSSPFSSQSGRNWIRKLGKALVGD